MPINLQVQPLLFLTLTVAVFVMACWIHQRTRAHPLANPVLNLGVRIDPGYGSNPHTL